MGIQIEVVVDYPINDEVERVLGLAEAVGEPVTVTFVWEGREEGERAVLVPAATLALWEHWAPTAYPNSAAGDENRAVAGARTGPSNGIRRVGVVVAELSDPDEAHWLQTKARDVRQGFMDPKQKAAFEEFLARQGSVDEQ